MASKLFALFLTLVIVIASMPLRAETTPNLDAAMEIVDHAKLVHKVKTLTIDEVNWKDISLQDALRSLAEDTKRLDPEHQGVNFVFDKNLFPVPKVTLSLKKVSLREVLLHIHSLTGYFYSIEDFAVSLSNPSGDYLIRRTFKVSPKVFHIDATTSLAKTGVSFDVTKQVAAMGVYFAPGYSAMYTPATEELVVVGNWDQIEAVDEILNP